jgi:hypothetical protein
MNQNQNTSSDSSPFLQQRSSSNGNGNNLGMIGGTFRSFLLDTPPLGSVALVKVSGLALTSRRRVSIEPLYMICLVEPRYLSLTQVYRFVRYRTAHFPLCFRVSLIPLLTSNITQPLRLLNIHSPPSYNHHLNGRNHRPP